MYGWFSMRDRFKVNLREVGSKRLVENKETIQLAGKKKLEAYSKVEIN